MKKNPIRTPILFLVVLHSQTYRDTTYKLMLMLKTLACCSQKLTLEAVVAKENSVRSQVGWRVVSQLSFVLVQPHKRGKGVYI